VGFYDVPVNQSVPTEANRGLTSYITTLVRYTIVEVQKVGGVRNLLVCATCLYAQLACMRDLLVCDLLVKYVMLRSPRFCFYSLLHVMTNGIF
jgi:hypothetical protein